MGLNISLIFLNLNGSSRVFERASSASQSDRSTTVRARLGRGRRFCCFSTLAADEPQDFKGLECPRNETGVPSNPRQNARKFGKLRNPQKNRREQEVARAVERLLPGRTVARARCVHGESPPIGIKPGRRPHRAVGRWREGGRTGSDPVGRRFYRRGETRQQLQ